MKGEREVEREGAEDSKDVHVYVGGGGSGRELKELLVTESCRINCTTPRPDILLSPGK